MTRSHVTIVVVTTIAQIAMMHSRLRRACFVNPQIDHKYVLMEPRTWSLLVSPFRSGNQNVPLRSWLMMKSCLTIICSLPTERLSLVSGTRLRLADCAFSKIDPAQGFLSSGECVDSTYPEV